MSLSADGNTAIVGGYGDNGGNTTAGAAWVWTRSAGVWTQQGTKLVGSGAVGSYAVQGASVPLSADGNTAIVGGPGDSPVGAAWVFAASAPGTFPGNRSNYSITKTSTGFSVRDNVGAGGTVELAGATQIKFADMTVNLLIGDLSKTIPADSLKTLIELYVAFFNRIPDSDGLAYWIGQFNSGMSLDQIAESFYDAGIQYSVLIRLTPKGATGSI